MPSAFVRRVSELRHMVAISTRGLVYSTWRVAGASTPLSSQHRRLCSRSMRARSEALGRNASTATSACYIVEPNVLHLSRVMSRCTAARGVGMAAHAAWGKDPDASCAPAPSRESATSRCRECETDQCYQRDRVQRL